MDFIGKVRQRIKTPLMLTGGFRTATLMAETIEEGALDFVGLGRPFCVFPHIAKELLNGKVKNCTVPDLLTGVEKIDQTGMLQTPWHQFQLVRMGQGKEPDPNMDVWYVYEKVTGRPRPEKEKQT